MTFRIALLLTATLIAPLAAEAQDINIPVHIGQKVWVTGNDGWEMKGIIARITPDGIDVSGETRARHFDVADIWRISTPDSIWSGTMIGAGIGVVASMPGRSYRQDQGGYAVSAVISYAAIGAMIDRANEGKHVIYERPMAPSIPLAAAPAAPATSALPPANTVGADVTLPVALGQTVTVTLVNGLEVDGMVTGQTRSTVEVKSPDGVKRIDASTVERITTPHASSKFRKVGVAYGATAGGLAGAMVDGSMAAIMSGAVFGGGFCGIIGTLLDHAAGGHKTVYQHPAERTVAVQIAPMLTLKSAGIGGSISWK